MSFLQIILTKLNCCNRYILYFMLESCISNTFILQRNYSVNTELRKWQVYKLFRLELATLLIGTYSHRSRYTLPQVIYEKASETTTKPSKRRRLEGEQHFPIKGQKGRCWYCLDMNTRHESSIHCRQCHIPLCMESRTEEKLSCFELYHQ